MEADPEKLTLELRVTQRARWVGWFGIAVVITAFLAALGNFLLPMPNRLIAGLLQPFIFVGIGSLLYHVGLHVHALNVNSVRMAMDAGQPVS